MDGQGKESEWVTQALIGREETARERGESVELLNNHWKSRQIKQRDRSISIEEIYLKIGDVLQRAKKRNRSTEKTHRQQILRNRNYRVE